MMIKFFLLCIYISITSGQSLKDDQQPIVNTRLGSIEGTRKSISGHFYEQFIGIRYGLIPKRFHYSIVNNQPWNGTLKANQFGPKCTQVPIEGTSEDCLFINIWRPVINQSASLQGQVSPLPVLLWVHGSAYFTSSGDQSPGDMISAYGSIIVATINYRLSAFGYAFGDNEEMKGNQGISDVITALLWTRENIGAFGGDPEKVTLGGHSAGSMITSMFPVLPTIDHSLYSQLFLLSGVSVSPMFIDDETSAISKTKLLAEKVACGPVPEGPLTPQVISCLQTVNASIILEKNQDDDIKALGGAEITAFIPAYGTPLIPKPMMDLFTLSGGNLTKPRVTISIGIAKDESSSLFRLKSIGTRSEAWKMAFKMLSFVKKDLTQTEMQPFYDYYFNGTLDGDERSLQTGLVNFINDYSFRCTSLTLSEVYSTRYEVYFHQFDYIIDKYGPEARPDGPWHSDLPSILFRDPLRPNDDGPKFPGERGNFSVRDTEISVRLIKSLGNFVTNGPSKDWPVMTFDRLNPEDKPLIREINYQDANVKYDKQSICLQWSKLLNFDPTLERVN